MKIVSFLITFVTFANCSYLLIPKNEKTDALDVFVQIGDFVVYKTNELPSNFNDDEFEVEEDRTVHIPLPQLNENNKFILVQNPGESHFEKKPQDADWHLKRIVNKEWFPYNQTGSCYTNKNVSIHNYILDTGIDITHNEFDNRAEWLANFADSVNTDCNNHGTHCAGLIGSNTYGVCKDAKLFAIKVLDCEGSGLISGIVKGLEYVYKHHRQNREHKKVRSIVSMSLGGGYSKIINRAVEALLQTENIYVVVAAGNENTNACDVSPASANGVITVMASDKYDNRAYFSNWGECADVYSPGVDIMSTIPENLFAVYSGTSMATPILVGVLNHYLDMYPNLNNTEVKNKLLANSVENALKKNPKQTKNLLVFLHRV